MCLATISTEGVCVCVAVVVVVVVVVVVIVAFICALAECWL